MTTVGLRRWWVVAAPSLIVAVPLLGFALQNDYRRRIYRDARLYGSDPIEAASGAFRSIGFHLDRGMFRPVGKFVEYYTHSAVFEAGEATGLAPHVVLGGARMLMVTVLAVPSVAVVQALMRSAGLMPREQPALALYPLVLAAVLVVSHPLSAVTWFPFLFIGSVALMLAVGLAVARDRDLQKRRLRWHEPVSMALLGAVVAMTFDLLYAAPPLAAAFIAARGVAGAHSPKYLLRTAALRRWLALSVGFLAVFVPARIEIAARCGRRACYSATDVSVSGELLELVGGRVLTGVPLAGWLYNTNPARLLCHITPGCGLSYSTVQSDSREMRFTLIDLAANSLGLALMVAVVVVVVAAAITARRAIAAGGDSTSESTRPAQRNLAAGLALFGTAAALLAALMASLSSRIQRLDPPVGYTWRDTLMVQVGWSFVIIAVIVAALALARARGRGGIAVLAISAALFASLTMTLLANQRISHVDRAAPLSSVVNQISQASVNPVDTKAANAYRCALIDQYTELTPTTDWLGGPGVRADLDLLMQQRHGWPFCDPARDAVGD